MFIGKLQRTQSETPKIRANRGQGRGLRGRWERRRRSKESWIVESLTESSRGYKNIRTEYTEKDRVPVPEKIRETVWKSKLRLQKRLLRMGGVTNNELYTKTRCWLERGEGRQLEWRINREYWKQKKNDRMDRWREHFVKAQTNPITEENIGGVEEIEDIDIRPWTGCEVRTALKRTRNVKAAGVDQIPPEWLKIIMPWTYNIQTCRQIQQNYGKRKLDKKRRNKGSSWRYSRKETLVAAAIGVVWPCYQ